MKIPRFGIIRRSLRRLNYNSQTIRFWSLTYAFMYLLFGIADYMAAPVSYHSFWIIRALVFPYFLFALLSTYLEVIRPYRLFINAVMVAVVPISIIIMIVMSDPAEWARYIYFSGIVLTAFPIGFILMNVKYTFIISIIVALSYVLMTGLGLDFYNGDYYFFTITLFFVVSALMAIVLCTYLLEHNQNRIMNQKVEVEELVDMKNQLINILAHDLRAPCNSIVGFSELIIKNSQDYEMKDAKFFMENVNKSAHNLLLLLQNLLEWSKMQSKNYTFNPVMLDLEALVIENSKLICESATLKEITLDQSVGNEPLMVKADKHMIETVLRNLLSNAVKFTKIGGKVAVKCWATETLACVSVNDNGVGIDKKRMDSLFEVLNAKSTQGTNGESGSGLGLVLCQEFIHKNEGHIWVKSEKGNGSTFTFTLPLCDS